jgi:hypothetical protein
MKKIALLAVTTLMLTFVPAAFAQNHGSVGVFVDYFKLETSETNNLGLGGRASFNVSEYLQLEGEVAYDFSRGFQTTVTPTGGGTQLIDSNVSILHGLFGPKIQSGGQAIRLFGTVKGGFINFKVDPDPADFGSFTSAFDLNDGDTFGVIYPGGGIEFYAGIIGLRFDIGDEIYFNNGAQHNLRITAGPHFRF